MTKPNTELIIQRVLDEHAPAEAPTTASILREAAVVARHPSMVFAVGTDNESYNISSDAVRIAQHVGLDDKRGSQGTQVNALRHALWQATVTSHYDEDAAREAGYAHEKNPSALHGVTDLAAKIFSGDNAEENADESIDLANNVIGREIGASHRGLGMNAMALAVLEHFHTQGLWMAAAKPTGEFQPVMSKLSDEQYESAKARLAGLDDDGMPREEKKKR